MPITTQDVRLMQPAVVNDQDSGGGRMSGNEVIDGDLNNLFDDITRLDRTVGRVSLRKAFCGAFNNDVTKWQGVHAIITEPASDPGVFVSMFGLDSHVDVRSDAQRNLEEFLAAGPPTPFFAWDTQPEGALGLAVFTNPANAAPSGGETLVLSVERGTVNVGEVQFIRVVRTTEEIVTVQVSTVGAQEEVKIITIEIDQPLRFDVPGESITNKLIPEPRTVIRRTTIAAGKRFYSVHPLTEAALTGETTLQLERTFSPVVPANQQQTGITDQQVGTDTTSVVRISADDAPAFVEGIRGGQINNGAFVYIAQRAIVPGSAVVDARWTGTTTRFVMVDDGRGNLVRDPSSGSSVPEGATGSVDYRLGEIVITGLGSVTASTDDANSSLSYAPGASVVDVQHTDGIEIDDTNRALVYTRTLLPLPRPATLLVLYRVNGRWITLRERGDGTLAGLPGEGSGTLQFATGSVNVTLGAEPDVGSHVLFGWGSGVHYPHSNPNSDIAVQVGTVRAQLDATEGIVPGSLSIAYSDGTNALAITDNTTGGLTGDGIGQVRYGAAEVEFEPDFLPASGPAAFTATYQRQARVEESPTPSSSAGISTYALSATPVVDSILIDCVYARPNGAQVAFTLARLADGTFGIADAPTQTLEGTTTVIVGYTFSGNDAVSHNAGLLAGGVGGSSGRGGTIQLNILGAPITEQRTIAATRGVVFPGSAASYNAGANEISISEVLGDGFRNPRWIGTSWQVDGEDLTLVNASIRYIDSSVSPTPVTQDVALTELQIGLNEANSVSLRPQGTLLALNARQYYDRAGVLFYRDANGNEQIGGSISYSDGNATLTDWPAGTRDATLVGAVTTYGRWTMTEAFWRVDAQQLLPGSYQLTYTREGQADPDQATSDQAGDIAGAGGLVGAVNNQTGVYALTWTDPVIPELTRYNAVAIEFLPVDPDVIGLDPVRLPANGQVPTLRAGDVVVIHHTLEEPLPDPIVADTVYTTRPGISVAEVFDSEGTRVPTDRFTVDNATGEIVFPSPLNLDGFVQPLSVRHRIEDMKQATDAQLNGRVQVNTALTHDFPADGNSFVSSALILDQELFAFQDNLFTQQSWTGEWSDEPIGSGTTGQFDTVNFPIEVSNNGAIRERWRVTFTSVTAFAVIGETVGQVATGDTSTDVAPNNPATGVPYFTIRAAAWSAGWNIGNQVRFNTEGAHAPIWINRTTLPGDNTQDPTDQFRLEARGDAN